MSDEAARGAEAEPGAQAPGARRSRAEATLGMAKPRPDGRPAFTEVEVTAGIASLLWIIVVTLILVFARTEESVTGGVTGLDGLRFVMTIIAVFLPVALIWVAATTVRWARVMQDEGKRLQAAVDAIRQGYLSQNQGGVGPRPALERRLDDLARAQRRTEEALASVAAMAAAPSHVEPASSAPVDPAASPGQRPPAAEARPVDSRGQTGKPAAEAEQSNLPLDAGAESDAEPLPGDVLISALNFPESPEDAAGFRALGLALQHRATRQLVQASQDVLTLLSQDGIYMDDLSPDGTQPALWRRFASGERGGAITELGGVRDKAALAQAAGRMRQDTIFRDAVHHFLRKYDLMLGAFLPVATDADIAALSDTRSGRAFMLLGRIAGAFD